MILASLFGNGHLRAESVSFVSYALLRCLFLLYFAAFAFFLCNAQKLLLKEAPNDTETETSEIYLIDETPQSEINPVEYNPLKKPKITIIVM